MDRFVRWWSLTQRLLFSQKEPITKAQAEEQSLAYWDLHFNAGLIDPSRAVLLTEKDEDDL